MYESRSRSRNLLFCNVKFSARVMLIIVITVEICTVFFGCLLLWKYWPPQNRLCPTGWSLQNISKQTTKIKHFVLKFPGLFCFEFFSWLLSESGTPKSTWPVQNNVKCCTSSELPVLYLISGTRSPGVANILRTCVQQMQCLEKMCITRTNLHLHSWTFASHSHTYKELCAGPTDNSTSQSFLRHFFLATWCSSRYEMWLVLHAHGWQESSINKAAGNWCRQWTTTDLIHWHPPWSGSCQNYYVLTTDFAPQLQKNRDWMRERLLKLSSL